MEDNRILDKTEDFTGSGNRNNVVVGCLAVILVLTIVIGFLSIGEDMQSLLRWELGGFVLNICALPLTLKLLYKFNDKGYIFGRVIGLTLASFLQWLLSSLHIMKFGNVQSIICCVITAVLVYGGFLLFDRINLNKSGASDDSGASVFNGLIGEKTFISVLASEVIFLALFIAFTWLLGHRIPSTETERVMDYAFMVTLNKTEFMPPLDVWAAGEYINYYYYGLYLITYLCKICFVPVNEGYSLGLSMIAALCVMYTFLISERLSKSKVAGIISAVAVSFAGNMHYVVFYKIAPTLWDILRIDGEKPTYWFASSTRYIGYIPEDTADRTISEFPSYSFLIGDLHAHVVDIMVVLTIVAILVSYAMSTDERKDNGFIKDIFNPSVTAIGFLLGISAMTNYWDLPIYFVVAGSLILYSHIRLKKEPAKIAVLTLIQGIYVFAIACLIKLPFELKFDKMINGVKLCKQHSYIHQLLILWGLPVTVLILLIIYAVYEHRKKNEIGNSDMIAILLGLCGAGLSLLPEIIYVADIYSDGFPRCNTMFKLTYEAFILLGIVMGYVFVRLLKAKSADSDPIKDILFISRLKRMTAVTLVLFVFTCGFFITACVQWFGEVKSWNYKGIDATSSMLTDMGPEADVVKWIEENTNGQEVILTADGGSYTTQCLIAALTGHPTVLGWNTHEWLWHNSRDIITDRQKEIESVYACEDINEAKRIIDKYDIRYIYVGPTEYQKYNFVDNDRLLQLGKRVYSNNEIAAVIIELDN